MPMAIRMAILLARPSGLGSPLGVTSYGCFHWYSWVFPMPMPIVILMIIPMASPRGWAAVGISGSYQLSLRQFLWVGLPLGVTSYSYGYPDFDRSQSGYYLVGLRPPQINTNNQNTCLLIGYLF